MGVLYLNLKKKNQFNKRCKVNWLGSFPNVISVSLLTSMQKCVIFLAILCPIFPSFFFLFFF